MAEKYDIVIYGATGFTGQLVAEYCDLHFDDLKWAIAGRNAAKLAALSKRLKSKPESLLCDASNPASLADVVGKANTVITTVGPYHKFGEPMVKACAEGGANYLDITGEPPFIEQMYSRYQQKAEKSGALLLHCCGFDSIPADLGAFFTTQQLGAAPNKIVMGYVTSSASFSGGTLASALNIMAETSLSADAHVVGDKSRLRKTIHYQPGLDSWALPLPVIDPMIIERSMKARDDYGPGFTYGHFLGAESLVQAGMIAAGFAGAYAAAQIPQAREMLEKLKPSGDGPGEAERAKSWFKLSFVGEVAGKTIVTEVKGGDPGYTETSKMVSEAAYLIATGKNKLHVQKGFSTPAAALGNSLIDVLSKKGISFKAKG